MAALLEEIITKIQSDKLSKIPLPTDWHVKLGSLKWLDEGLGERINSTEKNIEQQASNDEKASRELKTFIDKTETQSESSKESSKYRQLYRIAIYNGTLYKDDKDEEITGQTLVLFFRPNVRIAPEVPFKECGELDSEYLNYMRKLYNPLGHILYNMPGVHYLDCLHKYSEFYDERISLLTLENQPLMWS